MTHSDYDLLKGKEVFSADGEKVGSISQILHPNMDMPAARGRHFFLLDPGLMKDWFGGFNQVYLPESALDEVGSDRISLNLTADQIKQRGSSGRRSRVAWRAIVSPSHTTALQIAESLRTERGLSTEPALHFCRTSPIAGRHAPPCDR